MLSEADLESPAQLRFALRRRPLRRGGEFFIIGLLTLCAAISLFTTALIVYVLFSETASFFQHVSLLEFFGGTTWRPLFKPVSFGIWPLVAGTANVVFWSMLLALPIALATAVYLSEYASRRMRRLLKPVLEALAGVPTVVYAYFAINVITLEILRPVFGESVPVFNSLAASVMLAVMVLPTIASISEDAMASVPRDLREAAYALGATRLEVAWRVVVPAAFSGITASVLLAIARVVGETMIVAVAAGSTPQLTLWPLQTIQTMTGFMLQVGLGDAARGTTEYRSLFAVGSMLFLITLAFNIGAHLLVRRFREEYE